MTTAAAATTMDAPMFHSRPSIQEGDIVILFMSRDNMTAIKVTAGENFHNKFGKYSHDAMIGLQFGSKSGYIHLLRPTPELWTLSLPHRTQILYAPDISYITMRLGVRVGGKVIEAGTGSGSMTHSLSRAVGPRGEVCSFEYHKARFEKAGEEFEEHGLNNVRLQHRNVCKDGFGDDITDAESIFLDLPAPWEAIPHAVKALNPEVITRICCFSPCIEQVTKTASALRAEGFTDVSTQEVLIRTYDLAPPPTVGSNHLLDVTTVADRLRDHERRKEDRRVMQMRNARTRAREQKLEAAMNEGKTQDEAEAAIAAAEDAAKNDGPTTSSDKRKAEESLDGAAETKKTRRGDGPAEVAEDAAPCLEGPTDGAEEQEDHEATGSSASPKFTEPAPPVGLMTMVLTKPSPEMRGHTSYLTFATFYPASIRAQLAAQDTEPPTRRGTPGAGDGATSVPAVAKGEGEGDGAGQLAEDEEEGVAPASDVVMSACEEEIIAEGL